MKRKSILMTMVLSVVLALALLLSACGGASISDKPKDNLLKAYKQNNAQLPAYELSDLSVNGRIEAGSSDNFFLAKKVDESNGTITYTVYDFATLSAVFSVNDTATDEYADIMVYLYDDYFTVIYQDKTSNEYVTHLMDKTGTSIVAEDGIVIPEDFIAGNMSNSVNLYDLVGLFTFNGDLYSCCDGVITLVEKEAGVPSYIPYSEIYTTDYLWIRNGDSYVAYDKNLNVVGEYTLPSYATDVTVGALYADKLFVQYLVPVDFMSTDYEILQGTSGKYNLYQYVYSAKNGELKEVDLGGYIDYIAPAQEDEANSIYGEYTLNYGDNVAYATAYRVENKRINDAETIHCLINKDCAITATYSDLTGIAYVEAMLSNDRFLVLNEYKGMYQIVDSKMKVYGEFKQSSVSYNFYNGAFLIVDGDLYDHDFNLIYEAKEDSTVALGNNVASVTEMAEGGYYSVYLLKAGDTALGSAFVTYSETNDVQIYTDYSAYVPSLICVKTVANETTTYSYYTEEGVAVISNSATTYSFVTANEDVLIISTIVDGATVYKVIR